MDPQPRSPDQPAIARHRHREEVSARMGKRTRRHSDDQGWGQSRHDHSCCRVRPTTSSPACRCADTPNNRTMPGPCVAGRAGCGPVSAANHVDITATPSRGQSLIEPGAAIDLSRNRFKIDFRCARFVVGVQARQLGIGRVRPGSFSGRPRLSLPTDQNHPTARPKQRGWPRQLGGSS
jgi:hypothetical protein